MLNLGNRFVICLNCKNFKKWYLYYLCLIIKKGEENVMDF